MAWITPAGEILNGWSGAGLAWDDDTGTSSSYDAAGAGWTPYLELIHGALNCDKVRVWVETEKDSMDIIDIDVFYSLSFHNIYSGAPTLEAFAEYAIGSTQSVTAMRIRCHNSQGAQNRWQYANEADFNEVVGPVTEQVNLLVEDIVPYATTETAGAKKTVNLLDQSIAPYSVTIKTSAVVQVNLLDENIVPYVPIPRVDNQVTVNLLDQNIVPYVVTVSVDTSVQVNLLVQDIVPYVVTTKTGAKLSVSLLVQDIVPYTVTPRADNQVTTNLIVQKLVPYVVTTKTGVKLSTSLLVQDIIPYAITLDVDNKVTVNLLDQSIVPYAPIPSGGGVIKVVNLLTQKIIQLVVTRGHYVTDELVAYWKFDKNEGIYTYDTKGNNTGELKGGVAWNSSGKINSCCLYEGTDSYIEVQDDPSLDVTGDISLEFWLYPDTSMLSGVYRILSKRSGNDTAYEVFAWSGKYALSISPTSYKTIPLNIVADKWTHIIITQGPTDSNYAKIYENGQYVSQTDMTESITPNDTTLGFGCIIGIGQWWKGKIDEVRIYKKILSPEEVTKNYYVSEARFLTPRLTQKIVPGAVNATVYGDLHKVVNLLAQKIFPYGVTPESYNIIRECLFTLINPRPMFKVNTKSRNMFSTEVSAKKLLKIKTDSRKEDI